MQHPTIPIAIDYTTIATVHHGKLTRLLEQYTKPDDSNVSRDEETGHIIVIEIASEEVANRIRDTLARYCVAKQAVNQKTVPASTEDSGKPKSNPNPKSHAVITPVEPGSGHKHHEKRKDKGKEKTDDRHHENSQRKKKDKGKEKIGASRAQSEGNTSPQTVTLTEDELHAILCTYAKAQSIALSADEPCDSLLAGLTTAAPDNLAAFVRLVNRHFSEKYQRDIRVQGGQALIESVSGQAQVQIGTAHVGDKVTYADNRIYHFHLASTQQVGEKTSDSEAALVPVQAALQHYYTTCYSQLPGLLKQQSQPIAQCYVQLVVVTQPSAKTERAQFASRSKISHQRIVCMMRAYARMKMKWLMHRVVP